MAETASAISGPVTRAPMTIKLEGLNDDFRDLLIELSDGGVEFVIVGAYALGLHGSPRASGGRA